MNTHPEYIRKHRERYAYQSPVRRSFGSLRQQSDSSAGHAEKELDFLKVGEPSRAFYPETSNVIFLGNRLTRKQRREQRSEALSSARNVISTLVEGQIREDDTSPYAITGNNPDAIFAQYRVSDRCSRLLSTASAELKRGVPGKQILSSVVGKVFEDLAYGMLVKSNNENSVLLSPERSYVLGRTIFYPDSEVVEQPFGQNYIVGEKGSYIPDGYSINIQEDPYIEAVLEYKSNPENNNLADQIKRYNILRKNFPKIFSSNCIFLAVVPAYQGTLVHDSTEGVKVLQAPFTKSEYGQRITEIWNGQ